METKQKIEALLRETGAEGIEGLIEWLEKSDFYTAPASTKYHNAFDGGLAEHSLNVYHRFKDNLSRYPELKGILMREVILASLLHDLCKVNNYEFKKYKTKEGGTYGVTHDFPAGHGEKSVIQAMKHIKLTDREIILIRHHMGAPNGYFENMNFEDAREQYPELTLLICADLEASFVMEKRGTQED